MGRGLKGDQWAGTYIGRCGNRADNSKSLDAISARCDGRLTSESADRGIQGSHSEYRRAADPGRTILQA